MNWWWTWWLCIKYWKRPPPSAKHIWTRRCKLFAVRGRKSLSMFSVSSRILLPFKASRVRGLFLHTLSSGSTKERNREKSGDPGGHKYDMFPYQRGVYKCRSVPSVEALKNYSCTIPARTRNASEASLICFRSFVQILQAKTSRAWYMNNFVLTSCSEGSIL